MTWRSVASAARTAWRAWAENARRSEATARSCMAQLLGRWLHLDPDPGVRHSDHNLEPQKGSRRANPGGGGGHGVLAAFEALEVKNQR